MTKLLTVLEVAKLNKITKEAAQYRITKAKLPRFTKKITMHRHDGASRIGTANAYRDKDLSGVFEHV